MATTASDLSPHLARIRARIAEPRRRVVHDLEKGAFIRFAHSVGETSRVYTDAEYARTTRFRGLPATPTYISTLIREFVDGGIFDRDLPLARFLHSDDVVELAQPLIAGEQLIIEGGLVDAFIREGRGGPMLFQTLEIRMTKGGDGGDGSFVGSLRITAVSLD